MTKKKQKNKREEEEEEEEEDCGKEKLQIGNTRKAI